MHLTFAIPSISIKVEQLHIHSGDSAAKLDAILATQEIIMASNAQFETAFDRINVATSAIAQLIRDLIANQQAGNMSAEEEDAAQAKLLACADALEAMAAEPTNPIPKPVP